ncbi:hypothetical protein AVEN_60907-1, partial [Araneus ventricosus]
MKLKERQRYLFHSYSPYGVGSDSNKDTIGENDPGPDISCKGKSFLINTELRRLQGRNKTKVEAMSSPSAAALITLP